MHKTIRLDAAEYAQQRSEGITGHVAERLGEVAFLQRGP